MSDTKTGQVQETLSSLATMAQSDGDTRATAEHVVELAKQTLDCDFAGITVRRAGGVLESLAVTDEIVQQCDDLQYRLHEGPCIQALTEGEDLTVEDVAGDSRWPRWGPKAGDLGLVSMLAAQLGRSRSAASSLNLYSTRPRRFSTEDVAFAHVFAFHAASALAIARRVEDLQAAIDGRTLIGQAQGILMERFGLTAPQAFAVLQRCSQDTNTKLREVAEELVGTGELHQTSG